MNFTECCSLCSIVLKLQGETVIRDGTDIVAELINNREQLGSEVAAVSTGKPNTQANVLHV